MEAKQIHETANSAKENVNKTEKGEEVIGELWEQENKGWSIGRTNWHTADDHNGSLLLSLARAGAWWLSVRRNYHVSETEEWERKGEGQHTGNDKQQWPTFGAGRNGMTIGEQFNSFLKIVLIVTFRLNEHMQWWI